MFHLGFEVAKILTKILPQFEIYALVMGLQKFWQKFCPSLECSIWALKLQKFWQKFAPVWSVSFCHEVAKILSKILPRFGCGTFPGNNQSSFPIVISRKVLRMLFFQSRFKTTKFTLLLLFSKVSKLGFDSLCLCRVNVLSENVLISSMKFLSMLFKQKLPQFSKLQRCWVVNLFSKAGLWGALF